MADYFTNVCFEVVAAKDAAQVLVDVNGLVGWWLDDDEPKPSATARLLTVRVHDALGDDERATGVDMRLDTVGDDTTVTVTTESSVDMEVLCELLVAWLDHYNDDRRIEFVWSDDCSRPRLDAYGGGAAVVSRRGWAVRTAHSLIDDLHEELNQHESRPS